MVSEEGGPHICASCGQACQGTPIQKAIKTNFTDIDGLLAHGGEYLCQGCLSVLDDRDMRFAPVLFDAPGHKTALKREDVLRIVCHPPAQFVLSLPYSFKKHHWLYAGLSSDRMAYIGVDDRCIALDYTAQPPPDAAVSAVRDLLLAGVPRAEVKTGAYSTFTLAKWADFVREKETALQPYRPSGAAEMFVTYTPAIKPEKRQEETGVITETEQQAVNVIKAVARASSFRAENGIQFWGGFFLRRVNRYKDRPLHEFVSALAENVGCTHTWPEIQDVVQNIDNDDEVMAEIRAKAHLLISLAYGQLKGER